MIEEVIRRLGELDRIGIIVFRNADLSSASACDSRQKVNRILADLVKNGILQRVARGVYVNRMAESKKRYLVEHIACVLRRGYFNYVSLESILSEFGVISQIMISRITIMTTGPSGIFKTPYGIIEFTHTKRSLPDLIDRTVHLEGRPLRLATKKSGVADLRRVGRNVNMIDLDELDSDEF